MKLKIMMLLSVVALSSVAEAKNAGWQCWCANSGPGTFVIAPTMYNESDSLNILSQMGGGINCACRDAATGKINEIPSVGPGGFNP